MDTVAPMQLAAWLTAKEMSDAEFARLSGIGQRALIHKYRHGRQFPSPENLLRIRQATGGKVTADDFVNQHTAPDPPPRRRKGPHIPAAVAD